MLHVEDKTALKSVDEFCTAFRALPSDLKSTALQQMDETECPAFYRGYFEGAVAVFGILGAPARQDGPSNVGRILLMVLADKVKRDMDAKAPRAEDVVPAENAFETAVKDLEECIVMAALGSVEHVVIEAAVKELIHNWNDHNLEDQIDVGIELQLRGYIQ